MGISRRNLLKSGIAAAGLCLGWEHLSAVAAFAAKFEPRKPGSKILVIVQLAGGNDGINTVVPYASDAYYKVRPSLAIKREQVLKLNDSIVSASETRLRSLIYTRAARSGSYSGQAIPFRIDRIFARSKFGKQLSPRE